MTPVTAIDGRAPEAFGEDFRFRLLNGFQRGFPLVSAPYAELASRLATSETRALEALAQCLDEGVLSRVGAVFAPNVVGASTLAAIDVPADRLAAVAAIVSARPEVNHNYERDGRPNLWFVLTAESGAALARAVSRIETAAGAAVLLFPLLEEYRIDLGFALDGAGGAPHRTVSTPSRVMLAPEERRLIAALQRGLALVPRPYRQLAREAGMTEAAVLERLQAWIDSGVVRRLGLILRHRELGFRANAMVVWDVPDDVVSGIGRVLAEQSGVTLCYRRGRASTCWPFNLYCMIHGRERQEVLERLEAMTRACGLDGYPSRVLFSRTRFKQRGAHYISGSLE